MEGRKITPPKAPEPTKPSDLLQALRQSADEGGAARTSKRKPPTGKSGASKPEAPKKTKRRKAA
jgi:DNA end-binding protein Ku